MNEEDGEILQEAPDAPILSDGEESNAESLDNRGLQQKEAKLRELLLQKKNQAAEASAQNEGDENASEGGRTEDKDGIAQKDEEEKGAESTAGKIAEMGDPSSESRLEAPSQTEETLTSRSSTPLAGLKRSKWHEDDTGSDAEKKAKKKQKTQKQPILKGPVQAAKVVIESSVPSPVESRTPDRATSRSPSRQETPEPQGPVYVAPPSKIRQIQESAPPIAGCRSLSHYDILNKIDEGSYGIVFRGRDKETGRIVALKRLKMEKEKEGFPITSLREINTLLLSKHENIVNVLEIVVGESIDDIFIVMEFVEHDLKNLMTRMKHPFTLSEIKTIMLQLLSALAHLHDNWIIHRDLKTSNLLFTNTGYLKLGDFGLARLFGEPLGRMTPLVVTLWYRAPELLLGAKEYTTAIDMWSAGCIFAELVLRKALIAGTSEIDQLRQMFQILGTPNDDIWPGFSQLPHCQSFKFEKFPYNRLQSKFAIGALTQNGFDLLNRLLCYDPKKRLTAEQALKHPFFSESPPPKHPSMFPTWPSKAEGQKVATTQATEKTPQAPHAAGWLDELDEKERGLYDAINPEGSFKGKDFQLRF